MIMSSAPELKLYAIRRKNAWQSPAEVEQVGARSKQIADDEFPTDVRWIRSYVIAEEDGTLGSVCIYQAVSPEAIRKHAHRVDMPADEIWKVADTVVIRPDPDREPVAF
jgi:sporulation protein YlmC with PRC-barrel domain